MTALRKLLIVSPHFPPVNAADMQRVRMLLPFFQQNGWQATVLAIAPDQVAAPLDPWLVAGLPADVPVHRVDALNLGFGRIPGLGTLGLRALPALAKAGDFLMSKENFDLVYFSTTVFEVHILGPRWKRRYGVPFAMDYQDLWVSDYYCARPHVAPPGGRVKYTLARMLHSWMEPRVLRYCAGITAVSPEYPKLLARSYPWLVNLPHLVQGFPGSKHDFERLPQTNPATPRRSGEADLLHWVYVGRAGADMAKALRGLFRALRDHATDKLKQRLRLRFIGTSYAPTGKGRKSVAPIAAEFGLEHLVEEIPDRISYAETLHCLLQADALIVPGSDDPAYTASKIYPYLLAGRPTLVIFHENSTVVKLIGEVQGAVCVGFSDSESDIALGENIYNKWLRHKQYEHIVPILEKPFEPYTDSNCAVELTAFFLTCIVHQHAE